MEYAEWLSRDNTFNIDSFDNGDFIYLFIWSKIDIQFYISFRYTTVIWYLYTLRNDHHSKSSYQLMGILET